MKADAIRGHLEMLLLAILEDGPRHGYGIIEDLKRRSEEALDLPEGTVYPALHRLQRAGMIASRWDEVGGRKRRTYVITLGGRKNLKEKRHEWAAFASIVQRVLGGKPWPSRS